MFIKQTILALLFGAAFATAKDAPSAALVTEVQFSPASAELRADGKAKLRDIIAAATKKGEVAEVKVISWADKHYPQPPKDKLGNDARKLADERALEISGYFQDNTQGLDIDTYNMAERPNAVEELLKTSDARVKTALESSGNMAKAGRSIVLVLIK